jgi:hypothetical protein
VSGDAGIEPRTVATSILAITVLWIRDVYPGSRILILPIPDPKTAIKEKKFHKIENYLILKIFKEL